MTVTTDKKTDDDKTETVDDAIGIEEPQEIAESEAAADDEAEEEAESVGGEKKADEPEVKKAEPEAQAGKPAWRRRVLVGVVIAVFVAALALSGFLGWKVWQADRLSQASKQAQDAAVSYAQILTSIDSDKVDENFNQVLAGAPVSSRTCIRSRACNCASCSSTTRPRHTAWWSSRRCSQPTWTRWWCCCSSTSRVQHHRPRPADRPQPHQDDDGEGRRAVAGKQSGTRLRY